MTKTRIEWATDVWNPTTGCTKVSEGCRNCYAERIAARFWGERKFTNVRCHEERLNDPLRWRKPRRIFVNSMSDLFHQDVPVSFISAVWLRMISLPEHIFMVLTKRSDRMAEIVPTLFPDFLTNELHVATNIWLGVSVESQDRMDERICPLLNTPAAVRFVSAEPLLGPLDFGFWLSIPGDSVWDGGIDWVIVGGESGPGARPMHPDWVRSLRDQCTSAGVPFFFKAWGEWIPESHAEGMWPEKSSGDPQPRSRSKKPIHIWNSNALPDKVSIRHGRRVTGRLLDGREWNEFPG